MRKPVLLLLLLLMLGAGNLYAIPVPTHPHVKTELKKDTAKVDVRRFDAKALDSYRNSSEFDYTVQKNHTPSWWTKFWNWIWAVWNGFWDWVGSLLRKIFGGVRGGAKAASVIKYLLIGLVAVALAYLIARLFGMDLLSLIRKKKKTDFDLPYTETLENIHEIDFNTDIDAAIAVKNYRLAVRLLYLRCLKQLSDAGAIDWRIEKTNSAYVNELKDDGMRQQFAVVTRQFEYVWYGDFPVDGVSFQRINQLFQEFKNQAA